MKGRLQYLIRTQQPHAFQRNYDLRSVGSTRGDKVQAYVASQVRHHAEDDPQLARVFDDLQIVNSEVNLLEPRFTAHGRFSCNLHLVFVHAHRQRETRPEIWIAVRDMLRRASSSKGHLLSRAGLLPDHLHLTVGTHPDEAPRDVALSYMNNIAAAQGMNPVFMHGCYLEGFGNYDVGAIHDQ